MQNARMHIANMIRIAHITKYHRDLGQEWCVQETDIIIATKVLPGYMVTWLSEERNSEANDFVREFLNNQVRK